MVAFKQHDLALKPAMLDVDPLVIARQPTLTSAIILCQQLSGLEDKEIVGKNGIVKDQAQWSRIKSGQHYFPQDKLNLFQDLCGNEAPLLWLNFSRGYQAVPLETETQRLLRVEREKIKQLEDENRLLRSLVVSK